MNSIEFHKELCSLSTELNNLRMRLIKEDRKIELMEEYKSLNKKYFEIDNNFLSLVEEEENNKDSNYEIKDNLSFISDSTMNTMQFGSLDNENENIFNKKEKKLNITTTVTMIPSSISKAINIPKCTKTINQNNTKTTLKPKSKVNQSQNQNKAKSNNTNHSHNNNNNQKNNKKVKKINKMEHKTKKNIAKVPMTNNVKKMNVNTIANSAPKNRNFGDHNASKYQFSEPVYSPTKLYLSAKPIIEKNKRIFYEWTESKVIRILNRGGIGQKCIKEIYINKKNYVLVIVVQPISILNKSIKKLSNIIHSKHQIICEKYKIKPNSNNNNDDIFYDRNKENQSLFLTGFDITTDKNFYKKFEKFFLFFGNILGIHIGKDSKNYPFAIVKFEKLVDSIDCFKNIRWNQSKFGEKILNVSYARY